MNIIQDTRPWGAEEIFTTNEQTTVKILLINPGQRCSLQYHNHRKEFWKVIEGNLRVIINGEEKSAGLGDEFVVEPKMTHRLIGTDAQAKVLEISFGTFDENDIVRLEDDYNRIVK